MEPLTMFASTVGFIGALHLLFTTADRLATGRRNRQDRQVTREDWYCFFQPSALWGAEATGKTVVRQPTVSDEQRLEERRRQQANRPRLQL